MRFSIDVGSELELKLYQSQPNGIARTHTQDGMSSVRTISW